MYAGRGSTNSKAAGRSQEPTALPSTHTAALGEHYGGYQTGLFVSRPRYELQGWVTHWCCSWHDLKQPHTAKHTPTPTKTSRQGKQISSTTAGAGGALVGMPRSAAYDGAVAIVKATRAADPTLMIRRSIAKPPAFND